MAAGIFCQYCILKLRMLINAAVRELSYCAPECHLISDRRNLGASDGE